MRNLKRIDLLLSKPFYDLHEWCHYIVARMLRVRAERHRYRVDVYCEDWRFVPILLAPSIAGLIFGACFIAMAIITHRWQLAMSGIAINVAWQAMALRDLSCAWFLARHRRWPNNDEGFQGIPGLLRRATDGDNGL